MYHGTDVVGVMEMHDAGSRPSSAGALHLIAVQWAQPRFSSVSHADIRASPQLQWPTGDCTCLSNFLTVPHRPAHFLQRGGSGHRLPLLAVQGTMVFQLRLPRITRALRLQRSLRGRVPQSAARQSVAAEAIATAAVVSAWC